MKTSPNISTASSIRRLARIVPCLAAAGLLGACGDLMGSDAESVWQLVKASYGSGAKVTLEEAAAVPFASLGMRLGSSNEVMIILASDENGQQLWTSAARIALVTNNGRIVRTSGFGHDLAGYQMLGETRQAGGTTTIRWQGDFPELGVYSLMITCEDRPAGEETINILGTDIRTLRVEEHCSTKDSRLDWSFDNVYWRDPESGLVWRSIQHVNPKLDAVETEILRAPES